MYCSCAGYTTKMEAVSHVWLCCQRASTGYSKLAWAWCQQGMLVHRICTDIVVVHTCPNDMTTSSLKLVIKTKAQCQANCTCPTNITWVMCVGFNLWAQHGRSWSPDHFPQKLWCLQECECFCSHLQSYQCAMGSEGFLWLPRWWPIHVERVWCHRAGQAVQWT